MLVIGRGVYESGFARRGLVLGDSDPAEGERGEEDAGQDDLPAQRKSSAQRWSKKEVRLRGASAGKARIRIA